MLEDCVLIASCFDGVDEVFIRIALLLSLRVALRIVFRIALLRASREQKIRFRILLYLVEFLERIIIPKIGGIQHPQ